MEDSKGERGLKGVQEQHARVRRTCFLPQYGTMVALVVVARRRSG